MYEQLTNLPEDIRAFNQWVVWKYEDRDGAKPTKVPYSAKTGRLASVTDPDTWASFDEVYNALQSGHWAGAGFVFTEHDPFAGIDLDDTEGDDAALRVQLKIYNAFASYAERSPSGKGLHIIVRGHVHSGRRRGKIELYSSGRFFTMTGEVFNRAPIVERQTLVSQLWHELGGHIEQQAISGDIIEKYTDAEVIEKAASAVNGEKFMRLHTGDWQTDYPSQSEADQAYMNFLAFYSQHRIQLMRLFRQSPLGQREKAQRNGYLNYTINRAFDRMLPPIDAAGVFNAAEEVVAAARAAQEAPTAPAAVGTGPAPSIDMSAQIARAISQAPAPAPVSPVAVPPAPNTGPTASAPVPLPPGLLGEIADYIYRAAPRPVPEIALAGAIGLMAGVCGRAFNVSATGLNQYVLMLAPTGTGKEAMQSGIERFMSYVMRGGLADDALNTMPAVREFIGPAEISSGQALLKFVGKQRSFVSVVGEFGLTVQRLAHPRASSSEIMLKKVLLDLFNKSGNDNVLRPTIYSDKEKNTDDVLSPAFTLLGESTPETYYSNLDESLISDGLLPRFTTIEYTGPRPQFNEAHSFAVPSLELVQRFCALCDNSLRLNSHNMAIACEYTPEADKFLRSVDTFADAQINVPDQREAIRHLWNRAHIKTLKLAALVAVGCADHTNTERVSIVIDLDAAKWAYTIVERDIKSITRKFEMGEVGKNSEESKQVSDVLRVITQYLTQPFEEVAKYGAKRPMHADHIVPYTFIQRRLVAAASFRHDRVGATNAIRRTVSTLLDEGVLIEADRATLQKYNARGKAYAVSDPDRFKP